MWKSSLNTFIFFNDYIINFLNVIYDKAILKEGKNKHTDTWLNHSGMTTTFLSFRHVCRRNPVFLNMDARLISSGMTALIQHTHKHTSLSKCECLVIPNDKNTHFDKLNAFGLRWIEKLLINVLQINYFPQFWNICIILCWYDYWKTQ